MKNKLYIMVGVPGSGKSTYAKKHFPDAFYVSRDQIRFNLVAEDEEYFSKENEVFNEFVETINFFLVEGHDVVADATHLNPKSRHKLLKNLDINLIKNIEIIAVVMATPLEECIKRNENRKGTRAYVPPEVIKKMYSSFKAPTFEELYTIDNVIYITN